MKKFLTDNKKIIITTAFLIPIIIVALVSISHVTRWYEITNLTNWSLYLSIGIEIAALSSLAAISVKLGKKVYFPFIVVTFIQFVGNIYYSYSFININSVNFKQWVELVSPLFTIIDVEGTDLIAHKRILAFLEGGILPLISLSFLHMLVSYYEENNEPNNVVYEPNNDNNVTTDEVVSNETDKPDEKEDLSNDLDNQVSLNNDKIIKLKIPTSLFNKNNNDLRQVVARKIMRNN